MMVKFWRAILLVAIIAALPGGLLAYFALKHLLPLLPSRQTDKVMCRPQAWGRMN